MVRSTVHIQFLNNESDICYHTAADSRIIHKNVFTAVSAGMSLAPHLFSSSISRQYLTDPGLTDEL